MSSVQLFLPRFQWIVTKIMICLGSLTVEEQREGPDVRVGSCHARVARLSLALLVTRTLASLYQPLVTQWP